MSGRVSSQLSNLLSKMKVAKDHGYLHKTAKFGNSDLFNYATNKKFDKSELKTQYLDTWNKFLQYDKDNSQIKLPLNGFQEMIMLTEQGRLWKYPIDNEQGMEHEKSVPFEEHVFLDHLLEDFPKNEYIQTLMQYVILGLGRNHWMTVERKHEIIKFYSDYFKDKEDVYKASGFEL